MLHITNIVKAEHFQSEEDKLTHDTPTSIMALFHKATTNGTPNSKTKLPIANITQLANDKIIVPMATIGHFSFGNALIIDSTNAFIAWHPVYMTN